MEGLYEVVHRVLAIFLEVIGLEIVTGKHSRPSRH